MSPDTKYYFNFISMNVFLNVCMCDQKKLLNTLELEPQTAVSRHEPGCSAEIQVLANSDPSLQQYHIFNYCIILRDVVEAKHFSIINDQAHTLFFQACADDLGETGKQAEQGIRSKSMGSLLPWSFWLLTPVPVMSSCIRIPSDGLQPKAK